MKNKYFKSRYELPSWHPKKATKRVVSLGLALIIFPILFYFVINRQEVALPDMSFGIVALICGAGISILVSLFINYIRDKQVNDPIIATVTKATLESWPKISRMRELQHIDFVFSVNKRTSISGESYKFVTVKTTHTFEYANRTGKDNEFRHEMFSDFRHHDEDVDSDNKNRFRFELIDFDIEGHPLIYDEIAELEGIEKANELLACSKDHKLRFQEDIIIPAGQNKELHYKIHSEYESTDKLFWPFQEISENVDISIKLMKGFDNNSNNNKFVLKLYHPLENDILEKNPITKDGFINFTGKSGKSCKINLCSVMLPFQGFELSWKL